MTVSRRFRSLTGLLSALGALLAVGSAAAQDTPSPKQHPGFTGRLAEPAIIFGLREKLALSGKQIEAIQWAHDQRESKSKAAQREVKKRAAAFHGYLENDEIDPKEAARFLERLSKAENNAKQIHISIMIAVNEVLNSEQRTRLLELRESGEIKRMIERGQELQKRIQPKIARFQEHMQVYADLGGAPYEIAHLAEKISAAMTDKDFVEAEKLLDKALKASDRIK